MVASIILAQSLNRRKSLVVSTVGDSEADRGRKRGHDIEHYWTAFHALTTAASRSKAKNEGKVSGLKWKNFKKC